MEASLAARISARRDELGITREVIADAVGVSVAAVQQWECGKTKNLKLDNLIALADALNVSVRWLATGRGQKTAAANMDAYSTALGRRDEARTAKEKSGWERVAAAFAKAALVLVAILPALLPHPAEASVLHNASSASHSLAMYLTEIHIVLRRWLRSVAARIASHFQRISDFAIG